MTREERSVYMKNWRANNKNSIYIREKDYFKKHAERMNEWRKEYNKNPQNRQRKLARLRARKLKRLPCEQCQNEKSEAHHNDYNKPLEVIWLCRSCHVELHNKIKAVK